MVGKGNPLAYTGNILSTSLRAGDRSLNRTGEATLLSGSVVVSSPDLRSNMQIFVSKKTQLGTAAGIIAAIDRLEGKNFKIVSQDALAMIETNDDSIINFIIVKATED